MFLLSHAFLGAAFATLVFLCALLFGICNLLAAAMMFGLTPGLFGNTLPELGGFPEVAAGQDMVQQQRFHRQSLQRARERGFRRGPPRRSYGVGVTKEITRAGGRPSISLLRDIRPLETSVRSE